MTPFRHSRLGANMLSVDGSYLYNVGAAVHPLADLRPESRWRDAWVPMYIAAGELERFLNESVYRVRACRPNGSDLLSILKELGDEAKGKMTTDEVLGPWTAYRISDALGKFETVLKAEFGMTPMFLVTEKRGFDLATLIHSGRSLFPDALGKKVPLAVKDVSAAARCLAFELPTACGFHLHRANESVLRKYWEVVSECAPVPGQGNMGDYLRALEAMPRHDSSVVACLRDIKDLSRNPLVHPEMDLDDVDEAIALLGSVQAAIVHMLKAIPEPDA